MSKLKGLYVVWAVLVVLIVAGLCYMGFVHKGKIAPYKDYERDLEEATKKYVELNFLYPEASETLKVTLDDLLNKDLIKKENSCDGYTQVTFNGVYNYKAYIKCDNYTTNNYKK